jgi:tetratricopeptide (TPR) repeat protein/transglutaminase-like putative cysteine protease
MIVNSKFFYYPLLVFAVFSFSAVLNGQKSPASADRETLNLIRDADDAKGKETGALILLKDYRMTINEKGQTILVLRILGKIFTKEAIADYSQIPLGYNSYNEEPTLNYARVIQNDSTIREVPRDAVQVKTTPESQGLNYTDQRYLSFALPGLEIGVAFDYKVTFTQKVPEIEGEWYDNHWFAGMLQNLSPPYIPRIDPVVTSHYTLLVPPGTKFQYHLYTGNQEPVKESTGKQDRYQWTFKNLPSIKIEEAMPNLSQLNPVLIISSLKDWAQLDKWAAGKLLQKAEVTEGAGTKAKELTAGKENAYDKIRAIADFIQTNIRYVYADLNRGGYTPHSVNEILNSKYGDCKDQSVLLISMLKAVGIEAYPALINPDPYDEFTEIPIPQFSHLITYIPFNGKDLWLDMTSEVTPFPNLTFSDQGRTAFIVNGKGGRLTKTPASSGADNVSEFDMKTSFNGGLGSIAIKIDSKGMYSDVLKQLFKQTDANSRKEALKGLINSYIEKAVYDSVIISDVNNPEIPFSFAIKYHRDSAWRKGEEMFTWGSHTILPLSFLANVDVQSFPSTRYNDIVYSFPYRIKGTERYVPPVRDFLPVAIPVNDSIKNNAFEFTQRFFTDGKGITLKWSYIFNGVIVPKENYESYLSSLRSLKEKINWNITYVDPVAYITSLSQTENPYKLLAQSNQILQDDPKNILALLQRGMAYSKLRQDDQAIKAFRDILAIAPDNKFAHLFITYPQKSRENPAFVAGHLNQALEQDPDFEEALTDRALIFAEMKVYDKATADINRAIGLYPKSFRVLATKASVLFRQGKKHEAYTALEEALKVDSTNLSLCLTLAQDYVMMDSSKKAIELYKRAIALDSSNPGTYGNLGWAWYLENNDQKCIEYSKKAISIEPTTYFARYNLALANLRSGNLSEARRLYSELKAEAHNIDQNQQEGARKDLNELKAKGKFVNEIKAILRDFFKP